MVWEPSRLEILSPEDAKQAARLRRHRIRNGEKEVVEFEEAELNKVGGMGAPLVSQSASLPRRWRALFSKSQNDAPEERILKTDGTIGFSDDHDSNTIKNVSIHDTRSDLAALGSGLHVCAIDSRRAYKLSLDLKTLHLLRRVGGDSACPDCEY